MAKNYTNLDTSEIVASGGGGSGFTAGGDLSGTSTSQTVTRIQGVPVSATLPTTNQVLQYNGTSYVPATVSGGAGAPVDASYLTLGLNGTLTTERVLTAGTNISFVDGGAGGALTINGTYTYTPSDATTGAKGIVQLAGDLGNTAALPRVLKINNTAVATGATAGQVLRATGSLVSSFGSLDLSLAATVGTSILPSANMFQATNAASGAVQLAGDLAGTAASPSVVALRGSGISVTAPTANQVLQYVGSAWTPTSLPAAVSTAASFVTIGTDASLSNERVLTAGTNISIVDGGAGGSVTINGTYSYTPTDATGGAKGVVQLAGDLGGSAAAPAVLKINGVSVSGTPAVGYVPTATSSTAATWQAPAAGGGGAPVGASYLTLGTDGTLTSERVLTAGSGVNFSDGGAGSTLTINAVPNDATTGGKGVVQLTNDLGGTATSPTVLNITGSSGTTAIKVAEVTNSSVSGLVFKDKKFQVTTTNATTTNIATFALATSNTAMEVDVIIIAKIADGSKSACFKRSALYTNRSGVLVVTGAVNDLGTSKDDALWNATIAASGTNINVSVTGVAATTISWTASITTHFVS